MKQLKQAKLVKPFAAGEAGEAVAAGAADRSIACAHRATVAIVQNRLSELINASIFSDLDI